MYNTKINEIENLEKLYETLYKNSELPAKTDGFMYIIRSVDEQGNFTDNRCKIGETHKDVDEYINRRLYPRNPYMLKVVAEIRGCEWEIIFQLRYRQYNIHHEWYKFADEMLEFTKLLENKSYKVLKK